MIYALHTEAKEGAYRSGGLPTDSVDPINLIRNISSDLSDPQPVDVVGRVNGRHDRCSHLSDEERVILPMEPLVGPEVPDGGESGPGGVRDEVVISLDDFGGDQGGDDGGELLNGTVVWPSDPSIVKRLLDGPKESGRGLVQA